MTQNILAIKFEFINFSLLIFFLATCERAERLVITLLMSFFQRIVSLYLHTFIRSTRILKRQLYCSEL